MIIRSAKWLAGTLMRLIPEPILGRILPGHYKFDPADVPPPPAAPSTPVRLYIGPVNYAGQGWQWARAAENHLAGVGAVNMVARTGKGFGHPADNPVPVGVWAASRSWQRSQFEAVTSGFTHVIVESVRQPFGAMLDESVQRQVSRLVDSGLSVIMLCHGTDIRLPSRHIDLNPVSPFLDSLAPVIGVLERTARANRAVLDGLGLPVLVSTPDLLLDVPSADWLPVVVEVDRWQSDSVPLERKRPIVVHAPSHGSTKGSELIDPLLQRLDEEQLISYRRISGVPYSGVFEAYRDADIVLDQFRIGDYGVAACEAMAAGRVVVAQVSAHSRNVVADRTGLELPIVESTTDALEETLVGILHDRGHYQEVARAGTLFAAGAHDGRRSAEVLRPYLAVGN